MVQNNRLIEQVDRDNLQCARNQEHASVCLCFKNLTFAEFQTDYSIGDTLLLH